MKVEIERNMMKYYARLYNELKVKRNDSDEERVSLPIIASKKTLKFNETLGSLFSSKAGQIRQIVIDALASCYSSISNDAIETIRKLLGKLFN